MESSHLALSQGISVPAKYATRSLIIAGQIAKRRWLGICLRFSHSYLGKSGALTGKNECASETTYRATCFELLPLTVNAFRRIKQASETRPLRWHLNAVPY